MEEYKDVTHWWWAWNSEEYEAYLEAEAAAGWELVHVGFAMIRHRFRKTEAKQVRYCVDYHTKTSQEYELIAKDDGWHKMAESAGWIMWSKAYEDQRPALFTDRASMISRNKRLMGFTGMLVLLNLPLSLSVMYRQWSESGMTYPPMLFYIWVLIIGCMLYTIWKTHEQNERFTQQ